jgi:hypothetical protein
MGISLRIESSNSLCVLPTLRVEIWRHMESYQLIERSLVMLMRHVEKMLPPPVEPALSLVLAEATLSERELKRAQRLSKELAALRKKLAQLLESK